MDLGMIGLDGKGISRLWPAAERFGQRSSSTA